MTLDDLAAQIERCWLDHGNEDAAHDCGHDNFQDCIGAAWKGIREMRSTFSEREAIRLLVAAKLRRESGHQDAEYRRLKDEGWRIAFEVARPLPLGHVGVPGVHEALEWCIEGLEGTYDGDFWLSPLGLRLRGAGFGHPDDPALPVDPAPPLAVSTPSIAPRPIANAGDLLEELVAQGADSINAQIDRVVLAGIEAAEKEDARAAQKARDVTPGALVDGLRAEAMASIALDGDTHCCHDWSAGPVCRMCRKPQAGTDPGEACPGTPAEAWPITGLRFCTNDYCGGHTRAPWSCS